MNRNLHDALHSLAASGGDASSAPSALALAERSVAAVERRHRRRPVMIAGLTGVGVLTAGAAAALGYSLLQDDDAAPFPDRLTPETTMPSVEPVTLSCGADVADLTTTEGPLDLSSESVDSGDASRLGITVDPSTTIPLYLDNTTPGSLTFAPADAPGIYLVRDGLVVAVPAADPDPAVSPAESTLEAGETLPLSDDGVVPCPDSSGTTPATVPVGDYDAYGTVDVIFEGSTEPLEVVGGPWPVRVEAPVVAPPVLAAPPVPGPVALPAARPGAVFPECGAILDAPTGRTAVTLMAREATLPLGRTVEIEAVNIEINRASGLSRGPVLAAVKDGVVVGSFSSDPTQVPIEMYGDGGVFPVRTGTVVTTLCSDPSVPLPEGRYSIWAAQDLTFTSVYFPLDPEPTDPVTPHVPYQALSQVATLWMDSEGRSAGHPGLASGWPVALSHDAAFGPGHPAPLSVVWLATSMLEPGNSVDAGLIPSREGLADLGYTDTDVPFRCQVGLDAIGVDTSMINPYHGHGTAVVFASSGEAEAFVDLWEPLHGPVLGVVTGGTRETYPESVGDDDPAVFCP